MTTVDLAELVARVGQPPPIHFQRRASDWLMQTRDRLRDEGVLPTEVAGLTVDFLDGLRSSMNIENGEALRRLDLAQHISWEHPVGDLEVIGSTSVRQVVGLVARLRADKSAQVRAVDRNPDRLLQARQVAYGAKTRVRSVLPQLPGRRRGAAEISHLDVLFLPRMPGHLIDLIPVAHEVVARGASVLFGVPEEVQLGMVEDSGLPFVDLTQDLSMGTVGSSAAKQLIAHGRDALLEARGEPSDASIEGVTRGVLADSAMSVLRWQVGTLLRATKTATTVLERWRPRVIVPGNPCTVEGRAASLAAQARRIPSVVVEHGTIFPDDPLWFEAPVDLVCVRGEPSRDALVSCGVPEANVAITGAPRLDEVFAQKPKRASSSTEILVASSGPGDQTSFEQHHAFVSVVLDAADRTPELEWIVKLHPKDRAEWYQSQRQKPWRVQLVRGERSLQGRDIYDHLLRSAALVTTHSTAAVDAMVVGVPVITVAPPGMPTPEGVAFLESEATTVVTDAERLAMAVRAAVAGTLDAEVLANAVRFAERQFCCIGASASATADELERILSTSVQ